ncbi:MAG: hypothetical protein PWQ24_304 [Mesotoga sp.]|jgi:hypothetical protein|nr:hypothetical protein [Mesotoga sp.]
MFVHWTRVISLLEGPVKEPVGISGLESGGGIWFVEGSR